MEILANDAYEWSLDESSIPQGLGFGEHCMVSIIFEQIKTAFERLRMISNAFECLRTPTNAFKRF